MHVSHKSGTVNLVVRLCNNRSKTLICGIFIAKCHVYATSWGCLGLTGRANFVSYYTAYVLE